jgi:DNA-directed RNA polymerase subunit RPC12/RpoP
VERNLNQNDSDETSVCATCGEEFQQPLIAELHSGSIIEEYYACPRCLTKVGEVEHEREVETKEVNEVQVVEVDREEAAPVIEVSRVEETQQACPYYLGYLKKREKGTSIPETCLTCNKMIDCLRAS